MFDSFSADELTDFFNETFIRKQPGAILPNTNAYASEGFDNGWDFHHFHHVCVIKGGEGIYTGIAGVDNSWVNDFMQPSARADLVTEEAWNAKSSSGEMKQELMTPYKVRRLDLQNQSISKLTVLSGNVYFFNCETPPLTDHVVATDFISRLGILYELGIYFKKNIFSDTFKYKWPKPFQHFLMNRCPDPAKSPFNVAGTFLEIVKQMMDSANVTQDGFTNFFREDINDASEEFICIEDMYMSTRLNSVMQRQENHVSLRKDSFNLLGEPASILTNPEAKFGMYVKPNGVYQDYCESQTPRIIVVNFIDSSIPVTFANVEEIRSSLQPLTTKQVSIVTFNSKSPLKDLIKIWDDADIVITPSGPHLLAQGLFAPMPYTKALVEVTPFLVNPFYYHMYRRTMGFAEYMVRLHDNVHRFILPSLEL